MRRGEGITLVGRDILVDGYNIIKNSPSFRAVESKNFAAARETLISQLVQRYRHTPHQVIVVFDGDGNYEQTQAVHRVRVIYSRYDQTADSVIARLAAEARQAGREVEMYSNDGEVQQAVAQQGGGVHTAHQLTGQFNAPSRDTARRSQHRQAVRRQYGLDPAFDPDDEPDYRHHVKGKKKSSRYRR